MAVYYFLIIIPAITSLFYYFKKTEKSKSLTFLLFFLFLWLLLSLRSYDVGADITTYKYFFDSIRATSWSYLPRSFSVEIGYVLFNKLIGILTDNFSVFLSIISFIIIRPVYLLYKEESEDPLLSIALFINMPVFVMMFSGLRQAVAISISIIAFNFAKKKKLLIFILVILIAVSFHKSALIALLLYPLYHSKITKKWLWFVIPVLLAVFIFNEQLFLLAGNIIESNYFERYGGIHNTGSYTMIILFALFFGFSYFMVDDSKLNANTTGLRNILILVLLIQFFAPIHPLAMRMNYYFIVYIPLLIPDIILNSKKELSFLAKTAQLVMIMFFIFYFFYNAYNGADILQVFPYKFIWE
jgi:hypothetical protein